jgi:LacI family transcriptional regulator, galactose operon repressor
MAVTLRDISKRLNISVSTVCYALNGGPRPVPEELKQRIIQTAHEMGYRPNRLAKMLSTGRTHTVGVVPTELSQNFASGPFFQEILSGAISVGQVQRYDVLLFSSYDQAEPEFAQTILDGRVEGLIFVAPRRDSRLLEAVANSGLPFVSVGAETVYPAPAIICDNVEGINQAVDHLAELGHRKIAHVTGELDSRDGRERLEAVQARLQHHGLPQMRDWIFRGAFHPHQGEAAVNHFLEIKERPTAILFANDEMAFGFIKECARRAILLPETFSIVGFDDVAGCAQCYPSLTSVRQPLADMGLAAMQALCALIGGQKPALRHVFPTSLIRRQSVVPPSQS